MIHLMSTGNFDLGAPQVILKCILSCVPHIIIPTVHTPQNGHNPDAIKGRGAMILVETMGITLPRFRYF